MIGRTWLALFAIPCLLVTGSAEAASITFDFEEAAATAFPRDGALTTLSSTRSGFTIQVSRPGGSFDVMANVAEQTKPASFGLRSLDPFIQESVATPLVVNFSGPVRAVSVDMGDYGEDTPDLLTVQAFSGLNGLGSLVTSGSVTLPASPGDPFDSRRISLTATSGNIRSIKMIGGTAEFPNSVFYDNITVDLPPVLPPTLVTTPIVAANGVSWTSKYEASFANGKFNIHVDIRLTDLSGTTTLGSSPLLSAPRVSNADGCGLVLTCIWERGIEGIWSGHYNVVDGGFSYPLLFDVNFVTSGEDFSVKVDPRTDPLCRSQMSRWCQNRTGVSNNEYQDEVAAHEFGHMLGLYDEYRPEGANDPNVPIGTLCFISAPGQPFCAATMSDLGPTRQRYYDSILARLETLLGRDMSLAFAGEPPYPADPPVPEFGLEHDAPADFAVPQPAAIVLLLAGALAALGSRGRRPR